MRSTLRRAACAALAASALVGAAGAAHASPDASDSDSRPRHLAPGICHLIRTHQGAAETRIWLDNGPVPCSAPTQSVRLAQTMPAPDIISLLQQQAALLQGARLLLAGNTSCARSRSYKFTLTAMQPAPAERGAQAMYQLTFESDRDTTARVTVRKNRGEFTAWNVDCALQ